MMKEFPIVLACDDNYIRYTSVTIASIISNANKNIFYKIFILSESISEENQDYLKKWIKKHKGFSLDFIVLNNLLSDNFYFEGHLNNSAVYYRLYIPKIFKEYERVLYLDSDVIIDYDISYLATVDFEDNILCGVTDYVKDYIINDSPKYPRKYFYDVLKLNNPDKYINSGVTLFNIERINKLGIADEFIKIIKTIDKPIQHDQDLLNCVAGKWDGVKLIDSKFNLIKVYQNDIDISYAFILKNSLYRLFNIRNNKNTPFYIYHFLTKAKPWNSSRISKRLFYKYLFSIYLVKPPKKFIKEILNDDPYKYPLYWKIFLKYFAA
ncbi:MAG TPA: glycosyltransferase family 8 protein [Chryseobacterium sp.]|nr:glycosyltransferase family 8 protein [Chryseobacterium sp.]